MRIWYKIRYYTRKSKTSDFQLSIENTVEGKVKLNRYLREQGVQVDSFKGVDSGCVYIGDTVKIDWTVLSD